MTKTSTPPKKRTVKQEMAEVEHYRAGLHPVLKYFKKPDSGLFSELVEMSDLNEAGTKVILKKGIKKPKRIVTSQILKDGEKRDVLSLLHRINETLTLAHIEHITQMLDLKRISVTVFLMEEVFTGIAYIGTCKCGRPFPALSDVEKECMACELDSSYV